LYKRRKDTREWEYAKKKAEEIKTILKII